MISFRLVLPFLTVVLNFEWSQIFAQRLLRFLTVNQRYIFDCVAVLCVLSTQDRYRKYFNPITYGIEIFLVR